MRLLFCWLSVFGLMFISSAHAARELILGIQPYQPTRALILYHQSLAAHLRQSLKRPVRLVTAKDSLVFGQRILAGEYDLALAPAHLARLAQRDRGWHPLLRYVPDTPVFLLARKSDADATPASLRNKVLAVPDRNMLATLSGERWLAQHQLLAGRDYTILETDGYGGLIHALTSGRADMALGALAGMDPARSSDIQQLRIVKEIAAIPLLVFVARHDIDAPARAALQQALLAYQAPAALRLIPLGAQDLAGMDVYLPLTRQRLDVPAAPAAAAR